MNEMDRNSGVEQFDVEAVNKSEQRHQPLYAARKKVHPKRTKGTFRSLKWLIMAVTLAIYYVTPWLRWDRGPFAPDQAVLVDLENRRFYFFFIEIWPQEFYYIAGLLVMAGIGLFFVTSTVGRAWCGYTCPQTVWVDLFLVVERFFEGDRNARIKLDNASWSFDKLRKRAAKHIFWLLISVGTGGAWVFYFADAPELLLDMLSLSAEPIAYSTVAVLTATTYIFGGHMREQVCTYMCPWPRVQGAMLDEHSLVVTYNDWRGEPRRPHKRKGHDAETSFGDCVDCNACVAVCPMGIDIRDGQQFECITCALCIDACDAVMDKVGKDRGLISYTTFNNYNTNMSLVALADGGIDATKARDPETGKLNSSFVNQGLRAAFRLRTFLYLALWSAIGLAMLIALFARGTVDVSVLHDRAPLYVQMSDGSIRNGYMVKVANKRSDARTFTLRTEGLPGALLRAAGNTDDPTNELTLNVGADRLGAVKVYVWANPEDERLDFDFVITDATGEITVREATTFEGPEK